jgi:hypothetical protein
MSIFAGTKEIEKAVTIIGWIAIQHAAIDDALKYLLWQLKAFDVAGRESRKDKMPAETPALLRKLRRDMPRSDIEARVRQVTNCLRSGRTATRFGQLPEDPDFVTQWQGLASRIVALTKRRNAVVHSAVAWSAGEVVRTTGGTLDGQTLLLDPAHDQQLANDLGTLRTDLSLFTTSLGCKLPFAGDDKIITFLLRK